MIRFGIIGGGMIAAWHAQAVARCEGARLAGVVDASPERARAFALEHGGRAYDSLEAMLDDPAVDAVSICTPSGLHAEQAIQAMARGKHVLIEKPMALTVADADRVIAMAERMGVTAGVVSQLRFSGACRQLQAILSEGRLGRIVTAELLMKYHREEAYYAASAWRGTWAMDGGGALMNQGIHGVDLLLHLLGPVRQVFGTARTLHHVIEVEDTAAATLAFASGTLGVLLATTSASPGYPRQLSVTGTAGSVTLCEERFAQWDVPGIPCPEGLLMGEAQHSGASDPSNLAADSHLRQVEDMVQAIRLGRPPAVTLRQARAVVALICAVYASSRTNEAVVLQGETECEKKCTS